MDVNNLPLSESLRRTGNRSGRDLVTLRAGVCFTFRLTSKTGAMRSGRVATSWTSQASDEFPADRGTSPSSVRFCSVAVLDPRLVHALDVLPPFISVLSHSDSLLIHGSPVHVLMWAVRGLLRLRAADIVPCIISFSRQLPCFLTV